MDELRVPKHRTEAEVVLPGGTCRRVTFFVAEFAADHDGPERLVDLLNGGATFLPALDEELHRTTFLQCANLAVVRVPLDGEEGPAEAHTIPTEHEVELTLVDGQTLSGLLTYVLPPERSRLVDHLNGPEPFLRLHSERFLALVNKRFVARVDTAQTR